MTSSYRTHGGVPVASGHLHGFEPLRIEVNQRIVELIAFPHFDMKVGAGGSAGASHESYSLATTDPFTTSDQDLAQVSVVGSHVPAVIDEDRLPVAPIPFSSTRELHLPICAGYHRHAFAGPDVQAAVEDPPAETKRR
jgi:hypothetical protein